MLVATMGGTETLLYATYRTEVRRNRTLDSLRSGILIVMGLYGPFLILDYFVYSESYWPLLTTRISLIAFLAIAYWIAPRAPQFVMVIALLAVGFNLVAVIGIAGGVSSLYFPGIMLLFLGMPVLLPLTSRQSCWIVASLFTAYACLPLLGAGEFANREYFVNLFFPGAAALESIFSCALLDHMRFVDFCRTEEIAATRDELATLDDAKTRFSANVHHELRTPLTLLLAPLDGIYEGEYGKLDTRTRHIIKTMRSNGRRLLSLINNLLDLAKLENQQFSITPMPLLLTDLLNEMVDGMQSLAGLKNISIDGKNLSELDSIFADRESLDKVFMNLLGNAIKFTEPGGAIVVEGNNVEGGVEIRITDSGIGLEPEQLRRIFDRFAQVDTATTRKNEGTGIGLSLASELIGLHGGKLWASSPGIGHGTTMSVYIPHDRQNDSKKTLIHTDEISAQQSRRKDEMSESDCELNNTDHMRSNQSMRRYVDLDMEVRRWLDQSKVSNERHRGQHQPADGRPAVLVVDDNPDMRELLCHILEARFNIRCARNGREALEILETYEPFLVITDIMMPELNGTELCAAIKSTDRLAEIPVMIISSKADREVKVKGLELGADDYVTKPFHPREVLARATSLVNLRVAQKELRRRNIELQNALDDLRVAQSQLVRKERLAAVGEIAAGIAHEVNNPVNFALNAARALHSSSSELQEITELITNLDWQDTIKLASEGKNIQNRIRGSGLETLPGTVEELSSIIEQGLDRTRQLVGDLRDFASPTRAIANQIFDVRKSIESSIQLLQHELSSRGIELTLFLPDEPMLTSGNEDSLSQIFLNLLNNAVQALEFWQKKPADRKPSIHLVGKLTPTEITVEVSDNGPGIDPEIVSRLFDPFFTTKEIGVGTGLGLSTCQGIANSHDGRIEIESELGSGSTFSVILPRADSISLIRKTITQSNSQST